MSEPKRRFFEHTLHASAAPTVIGGETVIVGNVRGRGQFIVGGEIHGDGELEGGLNLLASGSWHGNIRTHQAVVAGRIVGSLTVLDKLEIGYTAVIRGKVSAGTIAIAKGAIVDGEIEIKSDTPIVRFDEKRGSV